MGSQNNLQESGRQQQNTCYWKNQQAKPGIFYGILGYMQSEYGRETSQNLVCDEDINIVVRKIKQIRQNKLIFEHYVFYRVVDQNPIFMTFDILTRLPESHCEYIYIVVHYKIVPAYFTLKITGQILDLQSLTDWINKCLLLQVGSSRLIHIMFNHCDDIRRKTIMMTVETWLNSCSSQKLKQFMTEMGVKERWFDTDSSRRKKILKYIENSF